MIARRTPWFRLHTSGLHLRRMIGTAIQQASIWIGGGVFVAIVLVCLLIEFASAWGYPALLVSLSKRVNIAWLLGMTPIYFFVLLALYVCGLFLANHGI